MILHTLFARRLWLFLALSSLTACASTTRQAPSIAVEGEIWARGNAPFVRYVLTTDQQNHYVLNLESIEEQSLETPVRARVEGYVYVDQWNGDRFAHLRVSVLDQIE